MKTRFNALDIRVAVAEINRCALALRVNNVYDIDSKTYILKLQSPNEKRSVLFQSASRIHLTDYNWSKDALPSSFTMKLRRHIKGKRLTLARQLGCDRIVQLQFGSDHAACSIFIELYSKGNIALTDDKLVILNILRQRTDEKEEVAFRVGEKYPLHLAREYKELSVSRLAHQCNVAIWKPGLAEAVDDYRTVLDAESPSSQFRKVLAARTAFGQEWVEHCLVQLGLVSRLAVALCVCARRFQRRPTQRSIIHTLRPRLKMVKLADLYSRDAPPSEVTQLDALLQLLVHTEAQILCVVDGSSSVDTSEQSDELKLGGFICETLVTPATEEHKAIYRRERFHPLKFAQLLNTGSEIREFALFSEAVDEYFSSIGQAKYEAKAGQREATALKKLENVRKDHANRMLGLRATQRSAEKNAQLIHANSDSVDRAISYVRRLLAMQLDWSEICDVIAEAREDGNEAAESVVACNFEKGNITLRLEMARWDSEGTDGEEGDASDLSSEDGSSYSSSDSGSEMDELFSSESDDEHKEKLRLARKHRQNAKRRVGKLHDLISNDVVIDLSMTSHANARRYFSTVKGAAAKEARTAAASSRALKNAEKAAQQTIKDVKAGVSVIKARKTYWFEKFLWFISSENYVVIGGRDSQQNEIIVKKHLRAGDVYVHADLHGATSVVIKNRLPPDGKPFPTAPGETTIPPRTLEEAGSMAVCHSSAWDAKVITSAWWVHAHQVSKTAEAGEYLTTGSFMIRGKKNYMPPTQLSYGFGFMFALDDTCAELLAQENTATAASEEGRVQDDTPPPHPHPDRALEETCVAMASTDEQPEFSTKLENDPDMDKSTRVISELVSQLPVGASDNIKNERDAEVELEIATALSPDIPTHKFEPFIHTLESNSSKHGEPAALAPPVINPSPADPADDTVVDSHSADTQGPVVKTALDGVESMTIQLEHATSLETRSTDNSDGGGRGRGRLSAKQRRELKKHHGLPVSVDSVAAPPSSQPSSESEPTVAAPSSRVSFADQTDRQTSQTEVPLSRGQKRKQKKIKAKYADQDEEDRQLKVELLAAAGGQTVDESRKNAAKQRRQKKAEKIVNAIPLSTTKQQQLGPRRVTKTTILHDERAPNPEQADFPDDEDDPDPTPVKVGELSHLTGAPRDDDVVLFPVAVAAPYSVVSNYRFKIKVTPGNNKKGKVTKVALAIFVADRDCPPAIKQMLRSTKDVDLSRNLPGKLKLSVASTHAATLSKKYKLDS